MKRLFLKSILFLTCTTALYTTANCQVRQILESIKPTSAFEGTPILKKGSGVLQVGIGMGRNIVSLAGLGEIGNLLGSTGTSNSNAKTGPFTISYEYLVKDNLGLGASVSYAEGSQNIDIASASSIGGVIGGLLGLGTGSTAPASVNSKVRSTTILVSTIYHLYITDKLDPYSKISIGATFWSGGSTNGSGAETGSAPTFPTPIAYDAVLGLRYFAGKQMGLYGELSYSNLSFAANIGLSFKLH
jgi:hypothetical protein